MKKIFFAFSTLLFFVGSVLAQPASDYYNAAQGTSGSQLKTALYNIVSAHTQRSYANLWTDFKATDVRADGKVWDIYSSVTNYTFVSSQCGNYAREGDCYNREHSFPKSWFDDDYPMYTDLFHLYPSDGYVNGRRGNYPFGEVGSITYQSAGGYCKLGSATATLGYSETVFEPNAELKGDFARTYFYMVTAYENRVAGWYSNIEARPTINGTTYPAFTAWTINMLLRWHRNDPVSEKETNRNDSVYNIQGNRNPFIDHPELAEYIWGNLLGNLWFGTTEIPENQLIAAEIMFDRENNRVQISSQNKLENYEIFSLSGQRVESGKISNNTIALHFLENGLYLLKISVKNHSRVYKIVK